MKKISLQLLITALFFSSSAFAMNVFTTETFCNDIIDSKDFTETEQPISRMVEILEANFRGEDEGLIDRLIASLDCPESHVKKNASLALTVLALRARISSSKLESWSKMANKKNFFTVEDAPDGTIVYVVGRFGQEGKEEGSMIYAIQPSSKTSIPVMHKTLTEEWVCLEGEGEFALKNKKVEGKKELAWNILKVRPGVTVKIDARTPFQFVSNSGISFKCSIITTPSYQDGDAVEVQGCWDSK